MNKKGVKNGQVYNSSGHYNTIDASDIVDFHKYLMTENNVKYCLDLLSKCLLRYCVLVDH